MWLPKPVPCVGSSARPWPESLRPHSPGLSVPSQAGHKQCPLTSDLGRGKPPPNSFFKPRMGQGLVSPTLNTAHAEGSLLPIGCMPAAHPGPRRSSPSPRFCPSAPGPPTVGVKSPTHSCSCSLTGLFCSCILLLHLKNHYSNLLTKCSEQ